MTRPILAFMDILGYKFSQPEILIQALTHSSATRIRTQSNQRMEFLGDRVLGLVISQLLYCRFKQEEEGELSRRHAALVRREALTRVALKLGISDYLLLSKAEEEGGGRANPNMIADACEALIAALYLDGGMKVAESFIHQHWEPLVDEDLHPPKDSKTTLQEWAQGCGLAVPTYNLTKRDGKDHAPIFHVEVILEGFKGTSGSGPSKRVAEQEAAKVLLAQIQEKA